METWRKSTYSGSNGGQCVEVGHAAGTVAIRDTTDRGGFTMEVSADAWDRFIGQLR